MIYYVGDWNDCIHNVYGPIGSFDIRIGYGCSIVKANAAAGVEIQTYLISPGAIRIRGGVP